MIKLTKSRKTKRVRYRRRGFPRRPLLVTLLLALFLTPSAWSQETFTISTSYQNLLSNPQGNGILDQLLREAFGRLGIDVEMVFSRTDLALVDVNAGIFDAEVNRIAGLDEQFTNLRRVPEPNMTMEFVAFSRRPIEIDGWESIRDLDIGIVRGWKILEDHTEDFPYVVTVPTEVQLFEMLSKERIDIALYAKLTGYAAVHQMGFAGISHLEPPLAVRPMYLYVHESKEALVDDIAGALRAVKADGTYRVIFEEVLRRYGISPGIAEQVR
jgi:polar amino acid transport system substrate-binding protein